MLRIETIKSLVDDQVLLLTLNVFCPGCGQERYWKDKYGDDYCQVEFIIMVIIFGPMGCGYEPVRADLDEASEYCDLRGRNHWYQCPQCKGEGLVKNTVCSKCEGAEEVHR